MALFKIFKGQAANLPTSYNDGYCYVTIDDGKMYIDTTNDKEGRIVLNAAHADTASSAEKLTANAGSATNPVYFSGGIPVKTTYTLKKSVPSDAVFTDTTYDLATTNEDGLMSAEDKVKLNVTNIAYGICETGGGTLSKEVALTNNSEWTLTPGSIIMVHFVNSNTVSNVTLNVNGTGDYPIWYNNAEYTSSGTAYCGYAGRTITYMFNGTHYVWLAGGYDTNSDVYLRVYRQKSSSYNKDYPLIASKTTAASLATVGTEGSKETVYGLISDNNDNIPTTNPYSGMTKVKDLTVANDLTVTADITVGTSTVPGTITATGTVTAPTFVGNLTGNAATATNATAADKLNSNAGSSTLPVYFSGGVPVATGTSLAVSVTGSAAKWATKRNFTISDGTNTSTAVAVDGSGNVALKLPTTIKAALTGNADTATNAAAADKLNSNAGDKNTPVYFSGGVPVACTSLDLNTTGSAAKWTTARKITITDGTNTSTAVNLDGSADVALNLPATIKATLTGNADTATNAAAADKLNSNAGSATLPVYFSGGVPVATGTSLAVSITKNAATATKWKTARNFYVADADATNTGVATSVDGSANATLKLPATIKANLTGNADTATKAGALSVNGGSASNPVYFSGGVPTPVTSIAGMTSVTAKGFIAENDDGNSITINPNADMGIVVTQGSTMFELTPADLSKLNQLANKTAGTTTKPIYFNNGVPTQCNDNLDVNISGTAAKASALNTNAGDVNTPVYFSGGVPVKCTSLDLNTSGNAATATKLKTARTISISDADGTNTATGTSFDGNANITVKLPATIKASLTGKATSAGTADKLASNAGDSNTPVYFSGGIPTKCTGLDLNTTGNAATATKWATARTINITDADGTNSGTAVTIDGTKDTTLKLPATIKANLTGNADTANKLNSNAGSTTVPVYFDGGIPNACTSLSLNTTGSAATLTTARNLTIMDYSLTYEGGKQPFDGSTDVILEMPSEFEGTLHGNADSATKLTTTTAGDANTPVYFTGGKPVACTSLDLNTSGNAATATKLATAQTISLTGDVTGSASFTGNSACTITATVADDSHNHSSAGAIHTVAPASQSIRSRITYISGGFNLGTGNNQIQIDGMTGNPDHISAPAAGCYNDGTSGNVQVARFGWPSSNYWTELFMSPNHDGFWHGSVKNGVRSSWKRIWMQGDAVTGAVWNDYAECRESDCEDFGYVLMEVGDDSLTKTTERLSHFTGVSSDTWGFSQGETDKAKTPIAVAGRVLVYPYQDRNNYKPGDCVCAAPGGTVDIMTREEIREWPDRIVGIVSCVPEYEEWGGGEGADRDPVKVNGRIWIKVK